MVSLGWVVHLTRAANKSWTLADQNLLMSDKNPSVVGQDVRTIFFIVNHLRQQ